MFLRLSSLWLLFLLSSRVSQGESKSNSLRGHQEECAADDFDCLGDRISKALLNPKTIVVDARQSDEVANDGFYHVPEKTQWVNIPCLKPNPNVDPAIPLTCPYWPAEAYENTLQDKKAPIIVYCGSGKRANMTKNYLQDELGYEEVYNANGYGNDNFLLP